LIIVCPIGNEKCVILSTVLAPSRLAPLG
jgi:hypothetical protein